MDDYYHFSKLAEMELQQLAQQGVPPAEIAALREQLRAELVDEDHFWNTAALPAPAADQGLAEPDDLADIHALLPPGGAAGGANDLPNRMLGGLYGRFAGCMLGKPLEIPWPAAQIRRYLELAGAYPLRDYVPLLEPFPAGFPRPPWERWDECTRGHIRRVIQDDDVEYTILALRILEEFGLDFTSADVGTSWLNNLAYGQVFTAERIAYRNLVNGLMPPETAVHRNPYREWIGAQIRVDVYGYAAPGQPRLAAELAWRDAVLSHTGNGIYGAMWVAAMVAAGFVMDEPAAIIRAGLAEIPPRSRLAAAIGDLLDWYDAEPDFETVLRKTEEKYGQLYAADEGLNWVHTIPNACLVALGLLSGEGDFSVAIGNAVMGGWDTDCNGATVGSIMGVMLGAEGIPPRWYRPFNNRIESYLPGCDGLRITDLARRIIAVREQGQTS